VQDQNVKKKLGEKLKQKNVLKMIIFCNLSGATTLSKTTLSPMGQFVTLSINGTQHNDMQHNIIECR
jgi:hypothetical protein